MRASVNAKRLLCGLPAIAWTDPVLSSTTKIREIHITELRSAINQAYTASGFPTFDFKANIIPKTTAVKKTQIDDLRSSVDSLVCGANISGACGPANGTYYSSAPLPASLCSQGTAQSFTSTAPWVWMCKGTGTGSDAGCATLASPPPPPPTAACGSAQGATFASLPSTGLCSLGTAQGLVYKPYGFRGDIEWKCVVSVSDWVWCLATGTVCTDTAPKNWTVGANNCVSNTYSVGVQNTFTASLGFPANCGDAFYTCGINGNLSGPSSTTCAQCAPNSCYATSTGNWGGGNCTGPGSPPTNTWVPHGSLQSFSDVVPPHTGDMTLKCNNGTWEVDYSSPYTCN